MRNITQFTEYNPEIHGEGLVSENPVPADYRKLFFSLPDGRTLQYGGMVYKNAKNYHLILSEVFHDDAGELRYLFITQFVGPMAEGYLGILAWREGAKMLTIELTKDGYIQPLKEAPNCGTHA